MNRRWNLILAMVAVTFSISSCDLISDSRQKEAEQEHDDDDEDELVDNQKLSRTFGHLLARQLRRSEDVMFDISEVAKGLQRELACKNAPLTEVEYEEKIAEVQKVIFERKAKENLSLAEKFLRDNIKNTGVVEVQPNKLQYKIVKEGTGKTVSGKPETLLHYKGSFINGQVFSSSDASKEPILLPLSQTIPGFALGMQGMREGEVRILYIHPDLAYGTSGQLPPNSLLIFEISLVQANEENIATNIEEGSSATS